MKRNLRMEKTKTRADFGTIVVCALLYAANRFVLRPVLLQGPGLGASPFRLFFAGYFNDILVIPVLCAFMGLWTAYLGMALDAGRGRTAGGTPRQPGRRSLFRQLAVSMARPLIVFPFTLIAGLFWEYITPLYLRGSVGDPLDLVMYLIGACLYLITVRICFSALRRKENDMYCNYCGKELPDDSAYCCYCGKAVGGSGARQTEPDPVEDEGFGADKAVVGQTVCAEKTDRSVYVIELCSDDTPVNIMITDIGPNRNEVKSYLEDKVPLDVFTYEITPMTRNDSAFIGEFSWTEAMKILEDLAGCDCHAEMHLIDASAQRLAARNYKPSETPAAPREPLSFGGVVGAVVVGGLICIVILSFF